jgi:hypothetical protein
LYQITTCIFFYIYFGYDFKTGEGEREGVKERKREGDSLNLDRYLNIFSKLFIASIQIKDIL